MLSCSIVSSYLVSYRAPFLSHDKASYAISSLV
nr:MAG TPA: hypothetical protein [Caudoviricetes sp.]